MAQMDLTVDKIETIKAMKLGSSNREACAIVIFKDGKRKAAFNWQIEEVIAFARDNGFEVYSTRLMGRGCGNGRWLTLQKKKTEVKQEATPDSKAPKYDPTIFSHCTIVYRRKEGGEILGESDRFLIVADADALYEEIVAAWELGQDHPSEPEGTGFIERKVYRKRRPIYGVDYGKGYLIRIYGKGKVPKGRYQYRG